jgi:hypothetical protein
MADTGRDFCAVRKFGFLHKIFKKNLVFFHKLKFLSYFKPYKKTIKNKTSILIETIKYQNVIASVKIFKNKLG